MPSSICFVHQLTCSLLVQDDYFDLLIDVLSRLTITNQVMLPFSSARHPYDYSQDPLTPRNALYIYQLFSILSMLLVNSTALSDYLHDRYLEDFQ